MRTPQQWMDAVRGSTRGHTDENLILIALACYDDEQAGGSPAIWHHASMIAKVKCPCCRCEPHAARCW